MRSKDSRHTENAGSFPLRDFGTIGDAQNRSQWFQKPKVYVILVHVFSVC